jgi:hypothetical protein
LNGTPNAAQLVSQLGTTVQNALSQLQTAVGAILGDLNGILSSVRAKAKIRIKCSNLVDWLY